MAELCRECFIRTWHPSQEDIDNIVMSDDFDMCEGCCSWGPYVDHIAPKPAHAYIYGKRINDAEENTISKERLAEIKRDLNKYFEGDLFE